MNTERLISLFPISITLFLSSSSIEGVVVRGSSPIEGRVEVVVRGALAGEGGGFRVPGGGAGNISLKILIIMSP